MFCFICGQIRLRQSDQIFYSQMPYPQHHNSRPNNIERRNTPLQIVIHNTPKLDAANPNIKVLIPRNNTKVSKQT